MRPHRIERITLHHGGVPHRAGRETAEYLRSLQAWSRREKRWGDVPYHYVVDPAGVIHEGRPIGFAGDTNTDYDPAGHALVVVLGDFEQEEPTPRQLEAAADAMAMVAARFGVDSDRIAGHKDHSGQTVLPGPESRPLPRGRLVPAGGRGAARSTPSLTRESYPRPGNLTVCALHHTLEIQRTKSRRGTGPPAPRPRGPAPPWRARRRRQLNRPAPKRHVGRRIDRTRPAAAAGP
jgi:hypothetical protein